ncbi:MAG: Sua5/YciO/YrdC/YwlC family protein [Malacoplasma sp.]
MVIYNEDELDSIAFELKNFKSAIFLTDTIFGILSINKNKIYKIKKRPFYKKIILFIPNTKYIKKISPSEQVFLNKIWPSPLTIIKSKISYRIPNDDFILKLLSKTGPLYCSSANFNKMDPITSIEEGILLFEKFNDQIIYVKRNRNLDNNVPSTIFNIDKHKVVREGSISLADIDKLLNT